MKIFLPMFILVLALTLCVNSTPRPDPPATLANPTATIAEIKATPTTRPTRTASATLIIPPTGPTPTLNSTEQAFSFQELIHYFQGGGGGGCWPYGRPLPLVDRDSGNSYPDGQIFMACPLGLPPGELVDLLIIDPQGREIPWMEVRVPDQLETDTTYNESFTRVDLPGFRSLALGSPDWRLKVEYSGGSVEGPLFLPELYQWWLPEEPAITHSRFKTGTAVNPFDPALRSPYRMGETIYLQGAYFSPDASIQLGIYRGAYEMKFLRSILVTADTLGQFEISVKVDLEFPDDYYSFIADEMFSVEDTSSIARGAFATFQVRSHRPHQVCDEGPASNLEIGDRAVMNDTVANNMRSGPGFYDFYHVTGKVRPGENVLILDGPACESEMTWWLVLNETSRLVGWTAEGDAGGKWLDLLN